MEEIKTKEQAIEILKSSEDLSIIPKDLKIKYPEIYLTALDEGIYIMNDISREVLIENKEICIGIINNYRNGFKDIPEEALWKYPELCFMAIKKDCYLLKEIPEKLKEEYFEICVTAIKYSSNLIHYIPEKVKKEHPEVCFIAAKNEKWNVQHVIDNVPNKIKENPEFWINVVQNEIGSLRDVPENMKEKLEVCMEAVNAKSGEIEFVPEEVKVKYPEICIKAVGASLSNLEWIPSIIKEDYPEIWTSEIIEYPFILKYMPEEVLEKYPDICIKLLKKGVAQYIPNDIKEANPDLCVEAAKNGDGEILKYIPDNIKEEHPELLIKVLTPKGLISSEYAPESMYDVDEYEDENESSYYDEYEDDEDYYEKPDFNEYYLKDKYIKEILKIDGLLLECASQEQRKNIEIALIAVEQNEKALVFVDSEIQEEIINRINKDRKNSVKWQQECLKEINQQDYVVLCSPTGSGKTTLFLEWAKQKEKKPIYITSPIKALSNQRYKELTNQGFTVGLETGENKYMPENCDFICCTQEIYTKKYTEQEDVTLIVDEFHYIFENNDRARVYIEALQKSKAENILLCSATLGEIDKLKQYIDKVSRKGFLYI